MSVKQNTPPIHKSKIGGQALFEGVMMRSPGKDGKEAMAVRKKDGTIYTEVKDVPANRWYQKALFVRGVFNLVLQMKNGYNYLMKSFEVSGFFEESEQEPEQRVGGSAEAAEAETISIESAPSKSSKKEKKPKKENKAVEAVIGVVGMIAGVAFGIFLFMFVPTQSFSLINGLFEEDISSWRSLTEGIIRIILFVLYMWSVSLMKEIRITYQYHGAEHKTIAAYEAGEELDPENVDNVMKYTKYHPRCGTSFLFLVLAISILIYSVLPINSEILVELSFIPNLFLANILRVAIQILLTPFIVAVTYEIIKLAGRYDRNIFMRMLSAPGLGLQRLTVFEPSKAQVQVAVAAMIPVIPENKEEDKW